VGHAQELRVDALEVGGRVVLNRHSLNLFMFI